MVQRQTMRAELLPDQNLSLVTSKMANLPQQAIDYLRYRARRAVLCRARYGAFRELAAAEPLHYPDVIA